jgi:hypothetical protein
MDAGEAALFVGELKYAFKRYKVRPQNKVIVRFVTIDGAEVEVTLDPLQGAINSGFTAAPSRD